MIKKLVLLLFTTGALLGSFQENMTTQNSIATVIQRIKNDEQAINNFVENIFQILEMSNDQVSTLNLVTFATSIPASTINEHIKCTFPREATWYWYNILDDVMIKELNDSLVCKLANTNDDNATVWGWFAEQFNEKTSKLLTEYIANLEDQDEEARQVNNDDSFACRLLKEPPSLVKSRGFFFDV